jgi:hypothetical protein
MEPTMNDPQDDRSRAERSATEQDLRATSASIQEHVKRLAAIERQKRRLPADHPQVETLSEAAVEAADTIARQARVERQLAEEIG